jgi:predicted MFS family arabinose efflux permease
MTQVFLAQGICVGLGSGLAYIPALAVISMNFTTKRPIAVGCSSIGSTVGGIIFPIIFRRLQPSIGFGWAVRTIAFVNLALSAVIYVVLCRKPGKRNPTRSFIDGSALREPAFISFSLALLFIFIGYYIPLFYIPIFATTKLGASSDLAFYLLAVCNAASFFGRTTPYLLGPRVKPVFLFVFWTVAAAIILYAWMAVTTIAGFIVWVCFWGYITGVLVTAPVSTVAHPSLCPSMAVIGARLGMSWSMAAIGILIGTPIAGALVNLQTAYFVHAHVFAGTFMLAGAVALIWPLVVAIRYDQNMAS